MKNITRFFIILTLLATISIEAQEKLIGNKEVIVQQRPVSNFSVIEIMDDLDILLSYNENQSVAVETDSNLQDAIITEAVNGVLTIKLGAKISRQKDLVIHISVNKNLNEIFAYNRATIKSKNLVIIDSLALHAFDYSKFDLRLNSKTVHINSKKASNLILEILCSDVFITSEESSDIKATIDTKSIDIKTLDKSSVTLTGSSVNTDIQTYGGSTLKSKDFKSKSVGIKSNNNSNAYINATETLRIFARNSSEIFIYSNPKITISEFFDKSSLHKRE
ncbi:GIN domain-containing protein [Lutibacter sp.]|uniref:GIN domain-containing protein n=1 Tax=Lutibacter sp. TaxID=1925666 RepID=UPI002736B199|nr:DUF2807 domain-containing protein [Lutibacter sp.]MDP3313137.1 DUF2807 domain-containing protein [Lutibacter sp.]